MSSSVDRVLNTVELLEMILLEVAKDRVPPIQVNCPRDNLQFHHGPIDGAKTIIAAQRVSKAIYSTIRGSSKLQDALNFRPVPLPTALDCLPGCFPEKRRLSQLRDYHNEKGSIVTGCGILEWQWHDFDDEALKMTFKNIDDLLVCLNGSWQETYISYPGTTVTRLIIEWKHEGVSLTAEDECCIVTPTLGALAERAIEITEDSMEQGTCYTIEPPHYNRRLGKHVLPHMSFHHGLMDWNAEIAAIEKWMT